MTDVFTEGLVFDTTLRPPKIGRSIEEHREAVIEHNNLMSAWMASPPPLKAEDGTPLPVATPQVAGEGGMARAVRWTPREVPPLPEEQRAAPPPSVPKRDCPQHQAEAAGAAKIPLYDHECFRADFDLRQRYAPKAEVKMLPDPVTGALIPTLLAVGQP